MFSLDMLSYPTQRTSFRDLSKRQAGTTLKVDVLAVDEGAERIQRLARKEVGLGSLQTIVTVSKQVCEKRCSSVAAAQAPGTR